MAEQRCLGRQWGRVYVATGLGQFPLTPTPALQFVGTQSYKAKVTQLWERKVVGLHMSELRHIQLWEHRVVEAKQLRERKVVGHREHRVVEAKQLRERKVAGLYMS